MMLILRRKMMSGRSGKIKVNFIECPFEGYYTYPVREDIRKKIREYMKEWNIAIDVMATELVNRETIERFVPKRKINDLRRGYTVTVLADPWEYLHVYGWDAHVMAENGEI